jgi:hypothetical protein
VLLAPTRSISTASGRSGQLPTTPKGRTIMSKKKIYQRRPSKSATATSGRDMFMGRGQAEEDRDFDRVLEEDALAVLVAH